MSSPTANCASFPIWALGVLHEDAIFPVRMAGIPINIRNTNEPDNPGTMIVESGPESHVRGAITGITGQKDLPPSLWKRI